MKKLFNIYDKNEEDLYKKNLMNFTYLPVEYITFQEVKYKGIEDEYIHVTIVDDPNFENKDTLVLFHGLTGSSVVFYRMYQKLATTYKIIGIDLPGMGCSSRNPVKYVSYQSTADYFTDRIKSTLDILKIDKFTLLGHSFGGYIAGLYAIRYHETVNKIIFLSPVGIGYEVACISTNPLEDIVHKFLYKLKGPPTIGYKFFGLFANLCFDVLMDNKCKNMTQKGESDIFKEFMNCLFRNTCVSEKAIFQFFDSNLRAFNPLVNHYKKIQDKQIVFFYGDDDWSPRSHAETFKEFVPQVKIEIVPESGHLMYSDNVDYLCDKIIEFEYDTQELESTSTDVFSESNDK